MKLLNTLLVLSGFALLGSLGSKIMHDREQTNAAAEILNGLKELTHLMDNIREEWDISFTELENIFNENRAGKESLKRENRSLY